jgi:hypothetical protein
MGENRDAIRSAFVVARDRMQAETAFVMSARPEHPFAILSRGEEWVVSCEALGISKIGPSYEDVCAQFALEVASRGYKLWWGERAVRLSVRRVPESKSKRERTKKLRGPRSDDHPPEQHAPTANSRVESPEKWVTCRLCNNQIRLSPKPKNASSLEGVCQECWRQVSPSQRSRSPFLSRRQDEGSWENGMRAMEEGPG